ncbi:MAG TPA: metal-dependent transcriptional regulator [Jatrophihabitantaceae bacterium]|nr:metal-dependent transcriptional regulator [Jatrophihabitantaceae bacterium]
MFDGAEKPTRAVEDYVKAIYGLAERDQPATTTVLATQLRVTASSVSAMLARLRAMGLITHRPYSDVSLSPSGLQLALRVIRRRRLVELFLVESLEYGWDEVEGEAELLEHAASDLFVERIAARLGDPVVDPHGDPIPTQDGRLVVAPSELLSRLEPGATGRLVRVWNGAPEVLRYLDTCGIELGDRIEVLGREPFGGSLVIRVGEPKEGRVHGFGYGLAEVLSIELDQP